MLTCISLMELVLIATRVHFLKLPFMRHISLAGTTGEGKTVAFHYSKEIVLRKYCKLKSCVISGLDYQALFCTIPYFTVCFSKLLL